MHSWPHTRRYLAFECRRIWQQGLLRILWKILRHLVSAALWFLLLPLTLALHVIGYRRINVFTDRIGHLAMEPDCLLKEAALGQIPRRRWFMLAPPGRVANPHLLRYWAAHLPVIQHPLGCFVLASMSRWGLLRQDVSHYLLATAQAQAAGPIQAQWAQRPPLLHLSHDDQAWGQSALRDLGLPDDAWFVCVHVREAGFSPVDESLQAHRNGSIAHAILAIEAIVARGGWVVRLGDPSMTPLPALPHVVDYAHHPLKSARLDVILCARARFILGNSSGIALVGTVFGTPCALANLVPVSTRWFRHDDIGIPKLLWSQALHRHLTFAEIMAQPLANFGYASLYADAGIRVDENDTDDIRALAIEMLDRLEGKFIETEADTDRHRRVDALFTDRHLGYGAASRFATSFLRRHEALMCSALIPAASPDAPAAG